MNFKSGWKSFDLGTYRPCDGTYCLYPYESLPPLPGEQFRGEFQWLEEINKHELSGLSTEWQKLIEQGVLEITYEESYVDEEETMDDDDASSRLERLVASAQELGLTLPPAFLHFMASSELQARIPSCTACYFDLAESIVPCPGSEDGYIIRFLNDQQSVLTWYLYLTPRNECCVLVSGYWLGEIGDAEFDRPLSKRDLRAARVNTLVCAPSFEAFLYRFWLENVIWYKLNASEPKPLTATEQRYVDHCALFNYEEGQATTQDEEDEDLLLLREAAEKELQAVGWEKDDDAGGWRYQKDAFLFHFACRMVIQPVVYLTLGVAMPAPDASDEDIFLPMRIECQDDNGLNFLLKEIIALQRDISLQNYEKLLQDLIDVHSGEIAFKIKESAMWQTVDAAARLFFTERSEEETDFQYWYNEGINHKTRGDHRQAAEAFQNAAEQAPAMAEAWHNVGFSRLALGQTEQGVQALSVAVKAYSHRLERYPYNAYNCFWLACVFSLLKEKEQALECLARAIDLNRDYQEEAENEEDLAWLRQDEDFLRLIEA